MVFVGIPVLIYVLIAVCTLLPGRGKKRTRYRPGQAREYPAHWWAGDEPVVAPILERLGYKLERAKTNVGLGRITNVVDAVKPETVGAGR